MKPTQYIDGPWRYSERENPLNSTMPFAIEKEVAPSAVIPIADICNFPPATQGQYEYQLSNAKLIAAAPEMISELQTTHDFLLALYCSIDNKTFNKDSVQQLMRDRMAKLLKVIEKATK